jgi:predicted MPP superfamily phosphohydrolase
MSAEAGPGSQGRRLRALGRLAGAAAAILLAGCAGMGRLQNVGPTVSPVQPDSTSERREHDEPPVEPLRALFGDTLIGFQPGTADSAHRFLGRLRDGYTADTLNIMLFGDNRPGYRSSRLQPQFQTIGQMFSLKPARIARGLIAIPVVLVKGLFPDLALIRDIPAELRHMPKWGREHEVLNAMTGKIDSLKAQGKTVAAVINTGDLVFDGRYPANWERFLRITRPLSSRIPYFAVAGNHERTDAVDGVENWRTATGLPVGGDRLYYCFDTADGWVRFIALDTNPIVDPKGHWTREVQVKYSDEEFTWLVARVKEHTGPVIVMMHHPPFSAGTHRMEWQTDAVLQERRARMVKALHESGISIIASGHEHSYQRALLTWPDAVLISIVSAGAGAPLNQLPPPAASAKLYSEYAVAGSVVKPENVLTDEVFNFVHLRLWFGGGEFHAYAVDKNAKTSLIDKVQIDLARYGTPKIDQHKMPLPPAKGPRGTMSSMSDTGAKTNAASKDSTSASERILTAPPPGKKVPIQKKPR